MFSQRYDGGSFIGSFLALAASALAAILPVGDMEPVGQTVVMVSRWDLSSRTGGFTADSARAAWIERPHAAER